MEEQTRKLLEECSKGCKMAVNSMNQIREYVQEERLADLISTYKKKHKELEEEIAKLLEKAGEEEKEPGMAVSALSWITTSVKLMGREDCGQIAKLLMDGCNMGIQEITEALHKYEGASMEGKTVARRLIQIEEKLRKELKAYL